MILSPHWEGSEIGEEGAYDRGDGVRIYGEHRAGPKLQFYTLRPAPHPWSQPAAAFQNASDYDARLFWEEPYYR